MWLYNNIAKWLKFFINKLRFWYIDNFIAHFKGTQIELITTGIYKTVGGTKSNLFLNIHKHRTCFNRFIIQSTCTISSRD